MISDVSFELPDIGRTLVVFTKLASLRLFWEAPPVKLVPEDNGFRLHWIARGEIYDHIISVIVTFLDNYMYEIRTIPKYPLYHFSVIGLLTLMGQHPTIVLNEENQLRSFTLPTEGTAIEMTNKLIEREHIIPSRLLELDISFEGYSYNTDIGILTFENPKPMELEDIIISHIETKVTLRTLASITTLRLFEKVVEKRK